MHPRVRPRQIVHLESMRERAVGQGRRRRMYPRRTAENTAVAAGAVLFRKGDDHATPRQVIAEHDGRDGIRDALLGALDDIGRDVLVTTRRRVTRQFRCLLHESTGCGWDGPIAVHPREGRTRAGDERATVSPAHCEGKLMLALSTSSERHRSLRDAAADAIAGRQSALKPVTSGSRFPRPPRSSSAPFE
jgi:hypothetical protein